MDRNTSEWVIEAVELAALSIAVLLGMTWWKALIFWTIMQVRDIRLAAKRAANRPCACVREVV